MEMNRRQFNIFAAVSAAGLVVPGLTTAKAQTNMFEGSKNKFTAAPPAEGKNWHPLAAERPHNDILSRIQGLMKRDGFEALILLTPENILYSTGYFSKFAYAPGVPAGAQTAAVIPAKGKAQLIVSLYEEDDAPRQTIDVEYSSVAGFVFVDDGTPESHSERDPVLDPALTIKQAVSIAQDVAPKGKIGIEMGMLLAGFKDYIDSQIGKRLADYGMLMYEARLIKFPWEVGMLRLAAQHAERFMARAARELKPGMNAMAFDQMIQIAAWEEDRLNSMSTLGYQTGIGPYWGIGLAPRNYVIKEGDVARIDGGGTHLGYISDISRTWVVGGSEGKPGEKYVETYDALYAGFAKGLEMLGPGVKFKDLYAAIRKEVEKSSVIPVYPRGHMGHCISVAPTAEDVPKISANEETVFQPGMCISMECSYMAAPGAPAPGPYNIEDSFVITEDGYERFTTAPDSIFWNV